MSCVNADCEAERKGWVTVLDMQGNEKHAQSARLIEQDSGRRFIRLESEDALDWFDANGARAGMTLTPQLHDMLAAVPRGFVIYLFPPGQQCFRPHMDREVSFLHRYPRGRTYEHVNHKDFEEDFNESADRVGVLQQRG